MPEICLDALVVGAGFAGIYQTHQLVKLGLDVKCIDKAGGIGGTWYWNLYPGAMSDTESYLYRYSWDKDDLQTYPWTHTYVHQPEILRYLNHVVDKHNLRPFIQLKTEMKSAQWDDDSHVWRVLCDHDTAFGAKYLVTALGLLSKPHFPTIPGLDSYQGQSVHTAAWPPELDLTGRTVGIIGNGSTGIQVMTAVAPVVKQLVSFQRHPQYSVPSGYKPVTKEYRKWVNDNYEAIYNSVWQSSTGFGVPEVDTKTLSVPPTERRRIFEALWNEGNGFRFMFSGFGDLTTDVEANREVCRFIHSKIDEIVHDPRKAALLKPKELYARRPLCDSGYYEIFNRDNVEIVSLLENPIESIVSEGVRTTNGKVWELDVLIYATGFDAVEGSYLEVAIKGKNGKTLRQHWQDGASAFAAVSVTGFPNMFLISGPQGPFANFPLVIESEVNFVTEIIRRGEGNTCRQTHRPQSVPRIMEVKPEAEEAWQRLCDGLSKDSVFRSSASWIFGTNVQGRKPKDKFYFGGLKTYLKITDEEQAQDFPSFY